MLITLVAFDDVADIELWLPWDLLNRVRVPDWQVEIVSDRRRVRTRTGILFDIAAGLARTRSAHAVIFCGGPGAARHARDPAFAGALRLEPRSQLLCAIGEGALFLGELGLLQGRRVAAAEPALVAALTGCGATCENTTLVEHGPVVTCAQSMAAVHLSEWLVSRLAGRGSARQMIDAVAPLDALAALQQQT
jgi:transcriptional regulator GlxA family with amidase domain